LSPVATIITLDNLNFSLRADCHHQRIPLALHPCLKYLRLFCVLWPNCLGRWEIGICWHSTLNLMLHIYYFKWSLSRRTSIREGCLMTKICSSLSYCQCYAYIFYLFPCCVLCISQY